MTKGALRAALAAAAASVMIAGPLAGTAYAGATVIGGDCGIDAGDVPGLPAFVIQHQTLVLSPSGDGDELVIRCSGELPTGLSVPSTYVGDITCFGDAGVVTGQIVVTKSGQVSYHCRWAGRA